MNDKNPLKMIDIRMPGGSLLGFISHPGHQHLRGYLSGFTNFDKAVVHQLRDHSVALLQAINVDVEARGQGIGSDLVAQFYLRAQDEGATAIMLICDDERLQKEGFDLHDWYKALGFGGVFETSSGPLMVAPAPICEAMRKEFEAEMSDDDDDEPWFGM
jgi:ribosomal protein S18 acetylase RimI-like enzyme